MTEATSTREQPESAIREARTARAAIEELLVRAWVGADNCPNNRPQEYKAWMLDWRKHADELARLRLTCEVLEARNA